MAVIDSGLPLPQIYKQRQTDAQDAYTRAIAQLAQQERGTFQDYGMQGQVDPNSGAVNASIDPNQRFGIVQELLRSHAGNLHSLRETLSGRNLGRTGLAAKRMSALRQQQSGDLSQVTGGFQKRLASLYNQRGAANQDRLREFNMSESDAVQYALQNGLFNQAGGAGGGGVVGGGSGGAGNSANDINTSGGPPVSDNASQLAGVLGQVAMQQGMGLAGQGYNGAIGGPVQGRSGQDEVGGYASSLQSMYPTNVWAESGIPAPDPVFNGLPAPPQRRNRAQVGNY